MGCAVTEPAVGSGSGSDAAAEGELTVVPAPLRGPAAVDCGLAGTVMRFVPAVAGLAHGDVRFDGDAHARNRPMGVMLAALRTLGAEVTAPSGGLPFSVHGTGRVAGGAVTLDASASSQFVSALLLAGARYDAGVDVRHSGKALPSAPHIAMTVQMLRERGVSVDDSEPDRWVVSPGPVAAVTTIVEPDLSSAAPFLAAALARGGNVTVHGWPAQTTQPGDQLRWILPLFGAKVELTVDGLTVSSSGALSGVDVDLHDVGELTPVLAVLAALATGPSYLRGVAHLRGHETDRLAALTDELGGLGADIRETADGLHIQPRPLHGGLFRTYDDHRLAQAAAVLGLAVPDIVVENIATTEKTYPGFTAAWLGLVG